MKDQMIQNQLKLMSDRELLEGIYMMLLAVMQEQYISDSKQLGINVIAVYQLIIYLGAEKEMKKITLQHVLGNKILEYDVDDRGVIIDEREKDRYAEQQDSKEELMSNWIKEHIVFYYDVKKQGATNETLKESAYLQDLSGKGRRMKLNNFLFAEMSGVGGYKNDTFDISTSNIKWELIDLRTIKGKPTQSFSDFRYYNIKDVVNNVMHINWHIDGIQEDNKVYLSQYMHNDFKIELHNGDNYVALDISESTDASNYFYVSVISDQPYSTDITITQIPEYPDALVTDGVDDYGLVENLSSGVKMLFMTVNPIGSLNANKTYYSQSGLNKPFWVSASISSIAYNNNNPNGITYIDGVLNESVKPENLFNIKHIITIVNGTVNSANSKQPIFFSNEHHSGYFPKLAFYNSIAFDSIPTEADGFTEQELIDYVIDKYELK